MSEHFAGESKMANTEIMATLAKVHSAKSAVNQARSTPGLGLDRAQSGLLDDAFDALTDVEDKLILQDIQSWIGQIKNDGTQLQNLGAQIKKTIASLSQVATYVQDAATAIGALASALSAAFSGGLIR
jgi:paraquat-inducible protein B